MSVYLPLTLHLAVALGVYAFAGSLGMLLMPRERLDRLFDEMGQSPGLMFAYSVIAFAVGAALIMVHHDWISPLGIVVTLAGWLIGIEGVAMLAFPSAMARIAAAFRPQIRLWCVLGLVLGALLILAGLAGRADALPVGVRAIQH